MRHWLRNKRLIQKLTQEEVAEAAGIARTTYAMIEQGERDPSVGTAKKIAFTLEFKWTIFFEDILHVTRNNPKEVS